MSKGMFQRLFERFSYCVVFVYYCLMSVNFRVKSYYIFDQIPTMGESQPIPVTNDNKSTALYWTRVADSSPGFSLDIGNEVKDIRENLYLYAMQRVRVGFSFVAFKSNAVLYFFSLLCFVNLSFQIWCQLFIARDRFTVLQIAI